jgi:ATP-binding cassette, subfamily B, bacterial PglK
MILNRQSSGVYISLRALLKMLNAKSKRNFYLLIILSLITGSLDALGIGSIMPFLAILISPDTIFENKIFQGVFGQIGFPDYQKYQIYIGCVVTIIFSLSILSRAILRFFQIRFCYLQESELSINLTKIYLQKDYTWFLNQNTSLISKHLLSDLKLLTESGYLVVTQLISNVVIISFVSIVLFVISPVVFLTSLCIILLMYWCLYVYLKRLIKNLGKHVYNTGESRFQTIQEVFLGIKSVKLFRLQEKYLKIFKTDSHLYAQNNISARCFSELPRFLFEWLLFGGVLLYATLSISKDQADILIIPKLGVFVFAGYRLMPAVQQVYKCLTNLNFIAEIAERIFSDYEGDYSYHKNKTCFNNFDNTEISQKIPLTGAIELMKVFVSYNKAKTILSGINMKIPAGSLIGITGPSGSGKTTLVDVLLGLIDLKSGSILFDNISISEIPKDYLYSKVGYVPQDTYVFAGSLADNICLQGENDNIDRQHLLSICKLVGLDQLGKKGGFDPFKIDLGDRGVKLSGGQKQRIGIARALYKKPTILILDESTSALDSISEVKLLGNLSRLIDPMTIFIIAHRLDTLSACNKIFVINDGIVADEGSYDYLCKENSLFKAYLKRERELFDLVKK